MLFSVIIPVYKVEQYLRQCVDSVRYQNFEDIQIILVDDGSPDKCPEICDEYAALDSRIQVVHKANGGLSDARNCGMEKAKGDYLLFLDSDDILAPDSLQKLAEHLKDKPDMLATEIFDTLDVDEYDAKMQLFSIPDLQARHDVLQCLLYEKKNTWPAPQYVLRRDFVIDKKLRFDVGFFHEDVSWSARVFAFAETIAFYNGVWYIRRLAREGSITNTVNCQRTLDALELVHMQICDPEYAKIPEKARNTIFERLVYSALGSLRHYKLYDSSGKKAVVAKVRTMQKDFEYAKWPKYRIMLMLMKCIGIHNTLMLFGMIAG